MKKYIKEVFASLASISGYDEETLSYCVKVEEDGVYPIDGLEMLPVSWRWKPRHALAGQPGIDSAGPSLSFDFTAADLACFLLTNSAFFLIEVWGDIETGPLGLLEPDEYGDAADAAIVLKQAYEFVQRAIRKIGSIPSADLEAAESASEAFADVWDEALEANKVLERGITEQEYQARHALAHSQTAEQKENQKALEEIAAKSLKNWRNAMTRYLLLEADRALDGDSSKLVVKPAPWALKKVVRARDFSYLPALRVAMQALIDQGMKPTASLVFDYWRSNQTDPIVEVGSQHFTYYIGEKKPKTVLRQALQNAIWRELVAVDKAMHT